MSVERSVVSFIVAKLSEFGSGSSARVYVAQPYLNLDALTLPYCVVQTLPSGAQDMHMIGDDDREVSLDIQVGVFATTFEEREAIMNKMRGQFESNTELDTYGDSSNKVKGIDLLGVRVLMVDSGDHKAYTSGQIEWFSGVAPTVYKNDAVITTGFAINYLLGTVTFTDANLSTDVIRATFKAGLVDFDIIGEENDPVGVEKRPVFAAFMSLRTFNYMKRTGQILM